MVGPQTPSGAWAVVADAPERRFQYSRNVVKVGCGAYLLTTTFNLELAPLGPLGTYFIQALVDGKMVAQVPLDLVRRG
jgi:hypothetical protein